MGQNQSNPQDNPSSEVPTVADMDTEEPDFSLYDDESSTAEVKDRTAGLFAPSLMELDEAGVFDEEFDPPTDEEMAIQVMTSIRNHRAEIHNLLKQVDRFPDPLAASLERGYELLNDAEENMCLVRLLWYEEWRGEFVAQLRAFCEEPTAPARRETVLSPADMAALLRSAQFRTRSICRQMDELVKKAEEMLAFIDDDEPCCAYSFLEAEKEKQIALAHKADAVALLRELKAASEANDKLVAASASARGKKRKRSESELEDREEEDLYA